MVNNTTFLPMLFSGVEGVLVREAGLTGRCVVEEANATLLQYPSVGSGLSDDSASLTTPRPLLSPLFTD